jgi:hypothetical protein
VRLTAMAALAAVCFFLPFASPAIANDAAHPTVVELYQSQGCSSCPPAIANVNKLAGRRDVLPLIFAVTYWDKLGWKDTFARPEFTERQYALVHANGRSVVATPQTIVNGRTFANGGDEKELVAAIRVADRGASGPVITSSGANVRIGPGTPAQPATIWLVRYDPGPLAVPIRAGENDGRTIVHRNVVRTLTAIGIWKGKALTVQAPVSTDPHLRSAILVQSARAGRVIAAARLQRP